MAGSNGRVEWQGRMTGQNRPNSAHSEPRTTRRHDATRSNKASSRSRLVPAGLRSGHPNSSPPRRAAFQSRRHWPVQPRHTQPARSTRLQGPGARRGAGRFAATLDHGRRGPAGAAGPRCFGAPTGRETPSLPEVWPPGPRTQPARWRVCRCCNATLKVCLRQSGRSGCALLPTMEGNHSLRRLHLFP